MTQPVNIVQQGRKYQTSAFRHWVQEMWMQHKDEYSDLKILIPEKDIREYFQMYKYWLKREYKHQRDKT